jgi:hypothetical protein
VWYSNEESKYSILWIGHSFDPTKDSYCWTSSPVFAVILSIDLI